MAGGVGVAVAVAVGVGVGVAVAVVVGVGVVGGVVGGVAVGVAVGVGVAVVVAVVMKPIASRLPDFSQPTELSILQQRVDVLEEVIRTLKQKIHNMEHRGYCP